MFERFTPETRRVVVRSQEISRKRKVNYIPSEHLLLALLEQSPDLWGSLRFNVAVVVAEVEAKIPDGDAEPKGHIPFTPNAKKTFEYSLREALSLDMNYIAPGHLLLGLVRHDMSGAGQILSALSVGIDDVRRAVVEAYPVPAPTPPVSIDGDSLRAVADEMASLAARLRDLLQ